MFYAAALQARQKVSAQQAGTASAAGTAGMGVLLLRVEHQRTAVLVHTGEVIAALLLYQF